jgi:hypothetical protein
MFELAISVEPPGEEAACQGVSRLSLAATPENAAPAPSLTLPTDSNRRRLCEAARRTARD